MRGVFIKPVSGVEGEIRVPGDKSISHRAALLGGMAHGDTHISNFLLGQDCLSTLRCLKQLGVPSEREGTEVWIHGKGMEAWTEPTDVLDAGNSGTTSRLMLGVLAGSPFTVTMTGDASLRSRPMRRVTDPLKLMGAQIMGRLGGNLFPLTMSGGQLQGQTFRTTVASAQVKSAIILAGLRASGVTTVEEPALSRDHTERMLRGFGVEVLSEKTAVSVHGGGLLTGQDVSVPGDISSAAFFLVLGSLAGSGEIILPNVGVNPTRTGILDALITMGADIELIDVLEICGEPRATLRVRPAKLRGIEIGGDMIPRLIDEIPILAVAACLAEGETVIRDAAELRVKESDRISTVVEGLNALGAKVEELPDGLRIHGQPSLRGGQASSLGDHRLAMAWAIAGMLSKEGVSVEDMAAADVSYPDFMAVIKKVAQ
ncbi:3-phosphoshikimate 1-carboxyvinyltransferase [Desulfosporosinus fructosivorans]|uniref:3-phosphoshikimate 1-carboxyvinyltransferase n=1 Tax=Desulfosporosinus fructosivorans TaxID=2018669 RepID=A0A4Z0R7Z3_9FIRM|nr:3-phosphoshikimate 1-carboxyvinyltransferase [Desulfosporosinus fructosivorans]TGE37726.1 3-phosphoshikimate 1-carboxyvinyltransferase [Desulfosporosinus fructosivorans]